MIKNYDDFVSGLLRAGFTVASGGNDEGIFSLIKSDLEEQEEQSHESPSPIHWHTGDPDTDPWEWRMRVLTERNDIAYSKFFFRKSGYITKEWYPYFLSARRGGKSFDEMYADGLYSNYAKRLYDLLRENGSLPLHEIKSLGEFSQKEKAKFDKALNDLQMGLFITMSGMQQKVSRIGIEYGWFSTVFCTVERFWDKSVIEKSENINAEDAAEIITERIFKLNPAADKSKIAKFIRGK